MTNDKTMKTLIQHLKVHRALYVLLPVFVVLILLAIRGIYFLLGRAPTEDPDVVLAIGYASIKIVLAIAFVVFVKSHDVINRPLVSPPDDWKDAAVSRGSTILLLWLVLHYLTV